MQLFTMQDIDWKKIWENICKYTPNKYILTLLIFAFIFLFAGEQSLINNVRRRKEIKETQREISRSDRAIREAYDKLNTLQDIDNMEQYAREHYLMHKQNEDVFLVEEE